MMAAISIVLLVNLALTALFALMSAGIVRPRPLAVVAIVAASLAGFAALILAAFEVCQ